MKRLDRYMVDFPPREHSISADVTRLKEARDFAERAAAEFGLTEDGRYQVKLAMSEAVTNAIMHGILVTDGPDPDEGHRTLAARS